MTVVASSAAGSQSVPIKASLFVHPDATAPLVTCVPAEAAVAFPNLFIATGQMSHLGLFEEDIHLGSCSVGASGVVMQGNADIMGANGDTLHVERWTLVVDPLTGAFSFTEAVLAGGTGRFAGASGSLTGGGVLNLADGTGSYTVEGTITNVGSTK